MMKVMKMAPNEKLVEFFKPESGLKEFRDDQLVSDSLRSEMEEVYRDLSQYMRERFFDDVQSSLEEFIDEHHPREEKRKSLVRNLIWWKILYDSSLDEWGCTEGYIEENYHRFTDKEGITTWLKEWDKAETKFYYIGHKYDENNYLVIDILDEKMLNVIVNDPDVVSPKEGEMVFGTLIPYGDGQYYPITGFYRFDYEAREVMGATFKFYYDKFLTETQSLSAAFIHVLSVMLQIERRINLNITIAK